MTKKIIILISLMAISLFTASSIVAGTPKRGGDRDSLITLIGDAKPLELYWSIGYMVS